MQSLFSELGKAGITVNLGIYYSHKKYLVVGLTLDLRLETFTLLKFLNICIIRSIRYSKRLAGAGNPRTTDNAAQEPMTSVTSTVWRGMSSNAELPESVLGLGHITGRWLTER
jgi:hypothetical protein